LFLTGAKKLIAGCKANMVVEFEMKDIDMMHYFLGLEVWQRPGEIFLGQGKYAVQILKEVSDGGLQTYGHTHDH
jgi:hypothetical protein